MIKIKKKKDSSQLKILICLYSELFFADSELKTVIAEGLKRA